MSQIPKPRSGAKAITAGSIYDYWRHHNRAWADVDLRQDPSGIANVCHAGAPYFVNRYAAFCQERIFERLLSTLPRPAGARALDVGCGAGRWSVRLRDRGYAVTGIDLQPELLERNRQTYPDIEFHYGAIQDFTGGGFDLVTSVTVIQHNPPEEQERIARALRALLNPGGHLLLLENIVDRHQAVFARSVQGWQDLMQASGMRPITHIPYDFRTLQRFGRSTVSRGRAASVPDAQAERAPARSAPARPAPQLLKRLIVAADTLLEPALVAVRAPGATHCAFLFRAE